jgi:hypothetical protein
VGVDGSESLDAVMLTSPSGNNGLERFKFGMPR